jgi:3-dehydroquinate synthase
MRTLEVSTNSGSTKYEIRIGENVREELFEYLSAKHKGKRAAVVTDDNVNRLYGDSLYKGITEAGLDCRLISIRPGEKSKSLEVLAEVYEALAGFNINRGDIIIAFGGGVTGDLAGFAAATYLRGITYIQVPTTLLAQVDSSIGGKTAIDLPSGKNLVGSFYQPEIVFIDTLFLATLEERFLRDGMAEVVKYGCIKDKKLFDRLLKYESLQQCITDMEELVYICCSIKAAVVEMDELDRGERMLLNFGHTFGHAVEQYYNYEKFTHGEAVAMGMVEITKRSEEMGLTEEGLQKL